MQEYKQAIKHTQQELKSKPFEQIVGELIKSPNMESSMVLKSLIATSDPKRVYVELSTCVARRFTAIETFPMLIFLYSLYFQHKLQGYFRWSIKHREQLASNQLILLTSWVTQYAETQVVQDTLQCLVSYYPSFLAKELFAKPQKEDIVPILTWVIYYRPREPKEIPQLLKLIDNVCEINLYFTDRLINKYQYILKNICEMLMNSKATTSGTILLYLENNISKQDVTIFCNVFGGIFLEMDEQQCLKLFTELSRAGINHNFLLLLEAATNILAEREEFYILRHLYKNFIFPVLIRRAKFCERVYLMAYQVSALYIYGFLTHSDIGADGIADILQGINRIEDIKVRDKWLQVCALLSSMKTKYRDQIVLGLKQQKLDLREFQQLEKKATFKGRNVWEVTMRTCRKQKKYAEERSKQFKGIRNNVNECYIISVIQSLAMTEKFPKFLRSMQGIINYNSFMQALLVTFQQLANHKQKADVNIIALKSRGPHLFATSKQQEDAQHYLLAFFQEVQKSIKHCKQAMETFKGLFQIHASSRLTCNNCGKVMQFTQNHYVYTIPHTKILQQERTEVIGDFECQKCNHKGSTSHSTITPISKIFYVHINRFSQSGGIVRKELATQTILREFLKYQLVGMIFHIGKDVEGGHYVYYAKIGKKRWAEMNDSMVHEFDLAVEDEEFQLEMKAEKTPYILVYQQK